MNHYTNHWKDMYVSYYMNAHYESDYECICIVINGKTKSAPLNILSDLLCTVSLDL